MYLPRTFAELDEDVLFALVDAHPLATVVLARDNPEIAHVPLVLDRPRRTLIGHVARANPIWRAFDGARPVTAVFHGPDAYVSPRFYLGKEHVPTWNYAVVQITGAPTVLPPGEPTRCAVERLVSASEAHAPDPWSMAELSASFVDELLAAIVAFELPLTEVRGKLKLSQNRAPEDREGVLRALREASERPPPHAPGAGADAARAMVALMEREG